MIQVLISTLSLVGGLYSPLASFPGPAQLFVTCSMESGYLFPREDDIINKWSKNSERKSEVSRIVQWTRSSILGVYNSHHLLHPHSIKSFLPPFYPWRHAHEKRYQSLRVLHAAKNDVCLGTRLRVHDQWTYIPHLSIRCMFKSNFIDSYMCCTVIPVTCVNWGIYCTQYCTHQTELVLMKVY